MCQRTFSAVLPFLRWLRSRSEWNVEAKQSTLSSAGIHDNLSAIKWLRQELNVPWPNTLFAVVPQYSGVDLSGPPVKGALACWTMNAARFAFASGCGWGNWRCQHYDADWYDNDADLRDASALLEWAHEQEGCPCTCDPPSESETGSSSESDSD